ncbi:hypothetical protein BUMB_04307c [Candidatus Paraburkholderia calva]|nr:hypothetical protein BUMB_04307c [Candidatus Paraburkholderia calva]
MYLSALNDGMCDLENEGRDQQGRVHNEFVADIMREAQRNIENAQPDHACVHDRECAGMNKTFTAYIAAALSGVVLVGILGAAHMNKPAPVDVLGCGPDVQGKTVSVLDTSDEVAAQTRAVIIERVEDTVEHKVHDADLVSVFTVSDLSKKNLVPAFAYCTPRRTGNELKESTRMLERHYVTKFKKPLQAIVTAPIKGSKESPIAQSLIDLSLSDYLRSGGSTTW